MKIDDLVRYKFDDGNCLGKVIEVISPNKDFHTTLYRIDWFEGDFKKQINTSPAKEDLQKLGAPQKFIDDYLHPKKLLSVLPQESLTKVNRAKDRRTK